jgi:DNA-binding transcriptional LysR family regulator
LKVEAMDNLGDIRLFVEAASLGGLSAAGRKLGLTPAAASARLAKLEDSLKTRLFERTTRQLRLTEEGRVYLDYCRQALQALDDAHAALQTGRNIVRGKLRISATSDLGRNLLSGWLDEFNLQYPDVSFALILSDGLSNMLQDEIDLAIRFGALPDSSLVARRLASNWRMLCASPDYIAKHGMPAEPRDLQNFQCIVHGTVPGAINEWKFHRGDEVQTYTIPIGTARETNDGAVAREWALRGHGVIVKSIWDIAVDLQAGRLVALLPEWRSAHAPLHAMYHRNRYLTPRLRALLDFLAERFERTEAEQRPLLNLPPLVRLTVTGPGTP